MDQMTFLRKSIAAMAKQNFIMHEVSESKKKEAVSIFETASHSP